MPNKDIDNEVARNQQEWEDALMKDPRARRETAALVAKFMIATGYYHQRMKLHIMLHPVFYVGGFLTAYFLLGK